MMEPYLTCDKCIVKEWCGRRNGTTPLPADYDINPDCNGYIMLEKAVQLSKIPAEYRYANKRNFLIDTDNAMYQEHFVNHLNNISDLVESGGNILLMHPQKGTGKSYTACSLGNEYIINECMNPAKFDFERPLVLYVKFGTWANDIRQMYQLKDEDYNLSVLRQTKRMKEVPLLIIDDIGSGRITPIIRDLTYDVIDYRKENQLSTIATTNLVLQQMEAEDGLGDIITSRLLYNTAVFQLGGRDRRKEKTYVL